MIALRLQEEVVIISDNILQYVQESCKQVLTINEYCVLGCKQKLVKILKNGQQIYTLTLQKKVKRITNYGMIIFIADKHGDMYSLDLNNLQGEGKKETIPLQTNLAMPKCLQYLDTGNKMLFLGDSYSKIKVYNAELIDEIFWIWVPFEGFMKQVIKMNQSYYFLYKRFDEHESPYFEIYSVEQEQINVEEPKFTKVFPITQDQISQSTKAKQMYIAEYGYILQIDLQVKVFKWGQEHCQIIDGLLTDCKTDGQQLIISVNKLHNLEWQPQEISKPITQLRDHQIYFIK